MVILMGTCLMTYDRIDEAIKEQTQWAIEQHGYFKNANEEYGVLLEEIDELSEAMQELARITPLKVELYKYMRSKQRYAELKESLDEAYNSCYNIIIEAIHVASVIQKMDETQNYLKEMYVNG